MPTGVMPKKPKKPQGGGPVVRRGSRAEARKARAQKYQGIAASKNEGAAYTATHGYSPARNVEAYHAPRRPNPNKAPHTTVVVKHVGPTYAEQKVSKKRGQTIRNQQAAYDYTTAHGWSPPKKPTGKKSTKNLPR